MMSRKTWPKLGRNRDVLQQVNGHTAVHPDNGLLLERIL